MHSPSTGATAPRHYRTARTSALAQGREHGPQQPEIRQQPRADVVYTYISDTRVRTAWPWSCVSWGALSARCSSWTSCKTWSCAGAHQSDWRLPVAQQRQDRRWQV
ncbi:hypothetical protein [Xylella fastidiosa]